MKQNNTERAIRSLNNPREQERLMKYVNNKVTDNLSSVDNSEKRRELLRNHFKKNEPSLMMLFNTAYDTHIDSFIETLLLSRTKKRNPTTMFKRGEITPKYKNETKFIPSKELNVKRSGKIYKRTKGTRFTQTERTFYINFITFRVKQGMTSKEIAEEYNKVAVSKDYEVRTKKSVSNFRHREKIKKD